MVPQHILSDPTAASSSRLQDDYSGPLSLVSVNDTPKEGVMFSALSEIAR